MTGSLALFDTSFGAYPSETPSTRFPVYTRGNAGEVWPEVAYPLSISISRYQGHDPFGRVSLQTRMVTETDIADGVTCFGGCFAGYMYLNLSFSRMLAIRTPGLSIEDNDATYLGTEGVAPPHREHPEDRSRRAAFHAIRYAIAMLRAKDLPHLAEDRLLVEAWQRRLPELLEAPDAQIVAAMREMVGPLMELFANHLAVSGKAGGAMQVLSGFCEQRLGDRSLVLTLLAGLGEVDSAAPSFALWELGRQVATDANLGREFDAGVDGLHERLRADPAGAEFCASFDAFIDRFGSRGPNEWESASDTWATDPALALALVDRMRLADESHDPARRAAELALRRTETMAQSRARLRWPLNRIFDTLTRAAALYSQGRERSKTTVIALIHVSRLLGRELGRRTAARVEGGTWEDLWFVMEHELDDYLADPAAFAATIAARRATRAELAARVPPFVFEGQIPDPATWARRDAHVGTADRLEPGATIAGIGGCAGVAEGRARVVSDPGRPGDLGPGDILVAPLTDPAWTPLFVPVEGVVVDVGGQMSHAVIVSRELGRPCVVAATDATRRIPDGAIIRVDGSAGTVTLVSLP